MGSRDLFWVDDPDKNLEGYNIYRALDHPSSWVKVNEFPVPGHYYRDITTLKIVTYEVTSSDWVSYGEDGQYVFRVPDVPIWSDVRKGRPTVANSPEDVQLIVNGEAQRAGRVSGSEGLIYLTNYEVLRKGGAVAAYPTNKNLKNNATPSVTVVYKKLTNYLDIFAAGLRTFYTVVPVKFGGAETHLPGALGTEISNTLEIDRMDYMQAEMVRRNAWLFEQSGEPSFLLVRKSKGIICQCGIANGEPRTGCPSCYETGFVGGYYGPFDMLFIDPDTSARRTLDEGGVKVERESKSYLGPTPIVSSGDMIVRRNGDRMVIANPTYKSPKGVLLQQEFDVILLPPGDTRYSIPLHENHPVPNIYDPRFEPSDPNAEPVTNPLTDPTKTWENPVVPKGRTVVFGNIQS